MTTGTTERTTEVEIAEGFSEIRQIMNTHRRTEERIINQCIALLNEGSTSIAIKTILDSYTEMHEDQHKILQGHD